MDKLDTLLGAAGGIAMVLLMLWLKAKWPTLKVKAGAWFTTQKSALEARAEGQLVDLEQRLKALEAAGVADLKAKLDPLAADVAALKAKVGA